MTEALRFVALALVSAVVVRAMIEVRLMDQPDARKLHRHPVPKGGGVGIVAAFMLGAFLLPVTAPPGFMVGAAAVALVSFADDLWDWPFSAKLAAQGFAAALAVGSGLTFDSGPWGAAVTLLWLVFVTNAVNFVDGMNGLAAGTALIASGFLALIAAGQGGGFVYAAALLLAAGLSGFLPFNFPRARIFMGDVGSQFCGFGLAVLGVGAARFAAVEMSFLIVPMLLSGLLWDVAFTLLRRALAGENLARAHRGHLYQFAQRGGLDASAVAMVHWGFAALGGLAALGFIAAPSAAKPIFPLALLLPQLWWTIYVLRRAPPLMEP